MNNETQDPRRQQALNAPHNLLVVDTVLKTKSDGQQVQLTLGWEAPNDALHPTATLVMSVGFAAELAKVLQDAAKTKNKSR